MSGETVFGVLAWFAVGAGYAWAVWNLGRLTRPRSARHAADDSSPLEITPADRTVVRREPERPESHASSFGSRLAPPRKEGSGMS